MDKVDFPVCPDCGRRLERVVRPSGSLFNSDQFASMRAGDWYCRVCPDNGRGKSGFRYFWDHEVRQEVAH